MTITLTNTGASGRRFASGEYQSRRFFGYGRFEARLKAIAAPGIVTGFFTYTGPSFDGDPHDEIDFEFLGKSPRQVQVNYYRSEEHTSELQSLMRISYAVFCLKKKKNITHTYYTHRRQTRTITTRITHYTRTNH